MTITLRGDFFRTGRGLSIDDGGGVTWSFDPATNTLSISAISGTGLAPDSVSNADLANMAQATIKGRASGAGTGDPTDLSASQVKTILALTAADTSDFNEAAEDAVLGASANSATISISYNDAGNSWSASLTSVPDATLSANVPLQDVSTFTGTLTGVTGTVTGTISYVKTGRHVTLYAVSSITGTSNSTGLTMTGVPAALRPVNPVEILCSNVIDNGTRFVGSGAIDSAGVITFSPQVANLTTGRITTPGTFTNPGTKGIGSQWSMTYPI